MTTENAGRTASLVHLADRVLNRPLLIHPDKAAIVAQALAGRIGLGDATVTEGLSPDASRFYGRRVRPDGAVGLNPVSNGVAIITIAGSLVNRGAWVGASSGLVSYEGLSAQVAEAATDPEVRAVILDIDSGGGEAGGITSLGASIAALAAKKRTVAVVNDTACSAAYWIASQASEIVVSETSAVGSIGVVVLHVDRSGEMAEMGWAPTLIHAGAHKVDGHPFGPLPDSVRADVQSSINDLYGTFCASVARGRGRRLSEEQARATEARVIYGKAAIAAGLADRVGTFEAVLAELQTRPAPAGARNKRGAAMAETETTTITAEAHAAAVTEATKSGATAERARIKSILTCDAAADRPKLARQVALETDLSPDAAAAIIGAAAPENGTGIKSLTERSKESPEPGTDLGAGGAGGSNPSAEDAEARRKRVVARVSGGKR